MDIASSQTIKGYELRVHIGAGGFGAVYRAYQTTVGREVAIKIILPGLASQPEFIRRFEGEAQIVARLEHPHITPLYDYWRDPSGAYLVMRWLRGGSLRDALANGPFELRAASLLLDQIAGALSLAHRNDVIHRDIKPGNILLDEDGNAYLTDFGVAKDLNLPSANTQQDVIVGSLDYISPEQARSEPVTPRTDIYSLGVTMFEIIAGHHPFYNISAIERLYKHINDPLPEIMSLEPGLQADVNRVIQKATAKNPEFRYPDALAFAADFREAIGLNRVSTTVVELLTQREHEILQLIIDGLSNKDIAQRLTITVGTVKWYVNQIFSKMGVRSRVQAIVRARELNLIVKPGETLSTVPIATEDFHPENPYKGLRAFQSADNQDFFGREKVTSKLIQRMGEIGEYNRFLAVVGPSGSGKSSLVKAGLIPALWRGDLPGAEKWFIVEMLPGSHPLDELEIALTKVAAHQAPNMREHLKRDARGLLRVAQLILPNDGSELALVIDQFEEVFTLLEDETERSHFLDLLYSAVIEPRSRVHVVVTLRADFYDRPLHYQYFGELVRTRLETIMPLSAEELERAIASPAQRVGVTFEQGLVSAIIAGVNYQPGALPLLQYALTELFNQRQGRVLTREAYQALGGTTGALAKRTEEVYLSLDETEQESARQMFLRLVTLGEGVEDTRRRTLRSELQATAADADMMDDIIDAFASYRLLSLDTDSGTHTPTVEVAHEALLREWERLRAWLNESRDEIKLQRQLSGMADEWQHAKQDTSFLARGNRLVQFETWAKESKLALTGTERAFLESSGAQHLQEQNAEAERKAREIRLEQRSLNFLRGLVAVLIVSALVGFGLAGLAIKQSQIARDNAVLADKNAAESQNVALVAGSQAALATGNTDLAIALALNAVTLNPISAPAQVALAQAAYAPGTIRRFIGHTDNVSGVVFSPDAHSAVSISDDGTMILWDVATSAIIRRFPSGHTGKYATLYFSPDGQTILSGATDGVAILHDAATGNVIRRLEGHTDSINEVRFSPDGQTALSASNDKSLILWDQATGKIIRRFSGSTAGVEGVAFIADGHTALSASSGQLTVWDVATGAQLRQFTGAFPSSYVDVSRDGRFAVTGSRQNPILLLWDMTTGQVIRRLKGHTGPVTDVKFSPDGKYILSGSDDGSMILWGADNGDLIRHLGKHDNSVQQVAFSPDGRYVLSASRDRTIRLWDLADGYVVQRFAGHNNRASAVQISPDGRTALTASWDGTAKVWDLQTGQELHRLTESGQLGGASYSPDGHTALISASDSIILWNVGSGEIVKRFAVSELPAVANAVFSPDGRTFLSSFWSDASVWLWNVSTGEIIRRFVGHASNVLSLAFSPDGRTALTGDTDGGIILWDIATGQPVRHFVGQTDLVGTVKFSKDGRTALSRGPVNGSFLWDVASGTILRHFDGGAIFSPDEQTVFGAAGSALGPNAAVLVDVATGSLLRRFTGFDGFALGNSFSADGRTVLVGFSDGKLELWRIDSPDELITWTRANRYIAEIPCDQRVFYRLDPKCAKNDTQLPPVTG